MRSFKQFCESFSKPGFHPPEPKPESHPLHKTVTDMGFKHKSTLAGTHNYTHPTEHGTVHLTKDGGFHSGGVRMKGSENPGKEHIKKAIAGTHYRVTGKLKEDGPDSPYATPSNFNDPSIPQSHVKKTPMPEDITTSSDAIEVNPSKRTTEGPPPRF
jgi:hypothetical protein